MSTITSLVSTDGITAANSMVKINTNFSNLNTDKIETSVIDTDTTLAANSDSKIPSQKAVKAYVDTLGNVNASETAKGIVEEATDAEVTAGTATGGTGAKLFLTPAKLATRLTTLLAGYQTTNAYNSGVITRDPSAVDAAVTTAHGLGTTPKKIKITMLWSKASAAGVGSQAESTGTYNGTSHNMIEKHFDSGNAYATTSSTTNICMIYTSNTAHDDAVASFDATNITLTWTKTGSPDSTLARILWEAWN